MRREARATMVNGSANAWASKNFENFMAWWSYKFSGGPAPATGAWGARKTLRQIDPSSNRPLPLFWPLMTISFCANSNTVLR